MALDNVASHLTLHLNIVNQVWESMGFEGIIEHRLLFLILEEKAQIFKFTWAKVKGFWARCVYSTSCKSQGEKSQLVEKRRCAAALA